MTKIYRWIFSHRIKLVRIRSPFTLDDGALSIRTWILIHTNKWYLAFGRYPKYITLTSCSIKICNYLHIITVSFQQRIWKKLPAVYSKSIVADLWMKQKINHPKLEIYYTIILPSTFYMAWICDIISSLWTRTDSYRMNLTVAGWKAKIVFTWVFNR